MSDLLSSLLIPKSSQESFHSASSQRAVSPPPATPPSTTQLGSSPVLHDVSAYLDLPANKALLEAQPKTGTTKKKPQLHSQPATTTTAAKPTPGVTTAALVPVRLSNPTSSASVSRFYELCQEKGLTPVWEIEPDDTLCQWFRGKVSVGMETVVLEERVPSKKEARQVLAERGCGVVRGMEARVKRGTEAVGGENWVGRLLEFSTTTPTLPAPTFTDYALGTHFACECSIPQRAVPFGGTDALFSSKKAAKTHAAREAVEYLTQEGLLELDGSVKKRKKAKLGQGSVAKAVEGSAEAEEGGAEGGEKSWGMRVNELALTLNLTPPTYRLAPSDPTLSGNIYSGAAYFPNEPLFRGPIGEVRHVLGKKKAREECARGVFVWMEELRAERLGAMGE